MASADQDAENFFRTEPAPSNLDSRAVELNGFLERHQKMGRCVVCVTSGGTTVPLEKNTVRFLDNFSTGSRGAACAEQFLSLGYAVIFLNRPTCMQPFARHLQSAVSTGIDLAFMDHLDIAANGSLKLEVKDRLKMMDVQLALTAFRSTKEHGTLLSIEFNSVTEYLYLLRLVAESLEFLGNKALFFLAAAVSDFYIPDSHLAQHKIQSREGALSLQLEQVPKMLGLLRHNWAPKAFFVSFKLETDLSILLKKAHMSVDKYGMHLVVANELHTRYKQVYLVTENEDRIIERDSETKELEESIVRAVAEVHYGFMAKGGVEVAHLPRVTSMRRARAFWTEHKEFILAHAFGLIFTTSLSLIAAAVRERYQRSQ